MNEYFTKNESGRDFIVGDLHGCYDLFAEKLKAIKFNKKIDRMFSVGDLIDRGEKSIECLRLIKESWFYSVMGNHEDFMIKSILNGCDPHLWSMNGGGWHYKEDAGELKELSLLASKLPHSMTIKTSSGLIGVSHAQPPSDSWSDTESPSEHDIQNMLWGRDWIRRANSTKINGVAGTFHGHTIIDKPIATGNVLFIDTGAFHTGVLTCIELINGLDMNKTKDAVY